MAFTITFTPPAYSSVQDNLVYTVAFPEHTGDPTTYPNYKFIGDVYVGATLVARIKKVPDPNTLIGIFDIGQIVRNYLTTIFNPGSGLVAQQMGDGVFSVTVTMKFGEEYAFADYLNQVNDSARVFFNNYNGRLIGVTSSLAAFANKIATNRPLANQTFLTSAYNFISYFPTTGSGVSIVVTPSGGGSVYSGTVTPSAANVLQVLNVSPVAMNATAAGTITAGTTSYTVAIGGQTFTFSIICEPQYQPYMIHFLNQYGGFESKIFAKVSHKNFDITRKDFGKLPFTVDGSGIVSFKNSNGVYNETRSTYSTQYTEKMILNTDNLSDSEYVWLRDLIISPMVFLEEGGLFFPVIISDNSYEPKKNVNDDMTNLTINIEFGNQLNAQYR